MPPDSGNEPARHGVAAPDPDRGRVVTLAQSLGEPVAAAGNRPVWLAAPGSLWLVERGALDIFLVEVQDGVPKAPFQHVLRLRPGRFAFGTDTAGELRFLAKGLPGTVLRRVAATELAAAFEDGATDRTLAEDADGWIAGILSSVAADIDIHPRPGMALAEGTARADGVLTSADGVVWVEGAEARLFGSEDPEAGEIVPLTPESWAVLHNPTDISVLSSKGLGTGRLLNHALPGFHRLALGAAVLNRRLLRADRANLQKARSIWRRRDEREARTRLFRLLDPQPPPPASSDGALLAALRTVARHEGIAIRPPAARPEQTPGLDDLLRASGVRARRIRLSPGDRWWRGDSGAILAFRDGDGGPVALLPGATGWYRLRDPATGASSPVRSADAESLSPHAYVLYRPLPDDGPVNAKALLACATGGAGADIARVVGFQIAAALLSLAPAVGIGLLIDRVLPSGDGGAILRLTLLLVLLALSATLFHVLRGTALMRVEARFAARATAGLWDRLLRLPTRFHRRHGSGETAMRALAFQALRDRISGATGTALLSAIFLVPSISLVFLYDAMLGWLSLGIGLTALAVTATFGIAQIAPQRRRVLEERRVAGLLSQLIDCVRKLQAAGAEGSARASWARRYRRQKLAEMRVGALNGHLQAFGAALPPLAGAALFAVAAIRVNPPGVGEFVVAYVASMVFYASIVALGGALEAVISVVPAVEQARPILAATPTAPRRTGPPAVLAGGLRVDSVSFRYGGADGTGAPVLDRVSIHARPGEFIAIVGESGAGKSTLIRLALGLETPLNGAIYYDDRDLAHLDPVSVRQQVGAVLQDGGLQTGTVLNNIIGLDESLTLDDAWRAARQAVVDRDIAAMPMQMHTGIGERASVVSGGQGQRIRVAQALARDPTIVFLDEATNWLDRNSQLDLMESIRRSTATRIVVAHRLSTIRQAHRIYVLQAGRVAQVGRFDELAGRDGPFRALMRRQMS